MSFLGLLTGLVPSLVLLPIDNARLVLETQYINHAIAPEKQFSGALDYLVWTATEQSVAALWRGASVQLTRSVATYATNHASTRRALQTIGLVPTVPAMRTGGGGARPTPAEYWTRMAQAFFASVYAATFSLVLVYPLDVIRTKMAADVAGRYAGAWDCAVQLYRAEGLFGFYAGFLVSLVGIVAYRAVYFSVYDLVAAATPRSRTAPPPSALVVFVRSSLVALFAGWLTYPLDTIRRRQMVQLDQQPQHYISAMHCLWRILADEGLYGLWAGAGVNAVRALLGTVLATGIEHVVKVARGGH